MNAACGASRPRSILVPTLLALLPIVAAACASDAPAADGPGGAPPAADAGPGLAGGTCLDILRCIGECPDSDADCPDACALAGSADGQAKILALASCFEAAQCEDFACAEANCAPSLAACVESSVVGEPGAPPPTTVPAGAVPGELVGTWARPGSTSYYSYTFAADGSASYAKYKESELGSCTLKVSSEWSTGSAVVAGAQLTVTLAAGATAVTHDPPSCGEPYTNPAAGRVDRFTWSLEPGTPELLRLIQVDCTAGSCEDTLLRQ